MKKSLSLVLAAMLVFAISGPAAAYFEDLHLIRTIQDLNSTIEVGSDLGLDVSTFTLAAPVNDFRGPLASLSLFTSNPTNLSVSYFAANNAVQATADYWATGYINDGDGLTMAGRMASNLATGANGVQEYYGSFSASQVVADQNNVKSYDDLMDKNGAGVGSFAQSLAAGSWEMNLSLADLLTVGYVDQLLYYFDYNGSSTNKTGVEVAVIRTFRTSDGTTIDLSGNQIATVINPSAVPVPGAVLLFGTGLLGFFGIRRKKN